MKQNLTPIAIVVDDYDKAIEFYTQKLHFLMGFDEIKSWVEINLK